MGDALADLLFWINDLRCQRRGFVYSALDGIRENRNDMGKN